MENVIELNSGYITKNDIQYYDDAVANCNDYIKERCLLDIYYPEGIEKFPTIVWFYGGGMTSGEKSIPEELKNRGAAVVGVNYRLFPRAKEPEYIEDAAASVSWTFNNIEKFGGDKSKIFVIGHSAGGYLTAMIGLDKKYLAKHGIDSDDIAGLAPLSAQCITHLTVREERGIDATLPLVDSMAPLFHIRADAPPMLLVTSNRVLEILGRYEENAYMWRMMKIAGHKETRLFELGGYDHGGSCAPSFELVVKEMNRILGE